MTEHEAATIGEFHSVSELIASNVSLQIAMVILVIGIISIVLAYRKFSKWLNSQKFTYTNPHKSRFLRTSLLPLLALVLITGVNGYIQATELFVDDQDLEQSPEEIFTKIITTLNIIVIGYTVSRSVPIAVSKYHASQEDWEDFLVWKEKRGFSDDEDDLFHRIYEWRPPKEPPEEMSKEEFQRLLQTKDGKKILENFRTKKGFEIGSLVPLVENPFEEWKKSEKKKYERYYNDCVTGQNEVGQKLRPGVKPAEIFPLDTWKEEKRLQNYDKIKPGAKPAGYAERQRELTPKTLLVAIPPIILGAFLIGILVWWNVDLFVLGTALAGLGVGVGFALKETLENVFAYLMIRKDKIFLEGDRVLIENYNGYIHKITTRATYIRHALNESIAIFPTRQMLATKVINFSKYFEAVPAFVEVGTSYLNDPEEVCSILVKVGKKAMTEIKDAKGRHLAVQERCPYLDENKPSCGCDKGVTEMEQPWVIFDDFGDSALKFVMWIYVRDYGSQFRMKSNLRILIYKEFQKHDIRIPWPIRTIYQGDQTKEQDEIQKLEKIRQKTLEKYGPGSMNEF